MSELAGTAGATSGFADYTPASPTPRSGLSFHVRNATDLDFDGIITVQADAARPPFEKGLLSDILQDTNRVILVALQGETVVGWAKTHYWPRDAGPAPAGHYLGGVTVTPRHRRQGVADELTACRLEWIHSRAANVWYFVNASNLASIDLHKRWGFEEVARGSRFHGIEFTDGTGILLHAVIDTNRIELVPSH